MNFLEYQRAARRATRLLVLLYVVAVACICFAVSVVVSWALYPTISPSAGMPRQLTLGFVLQVSGCVLIIIIAACVSKVMQLSRGGTAVALSLGGRRILPNSEEPCERRVLNVVEEVAIAAGAAVPDVYVLDGEGSINAFAAGYSLRDAVIGVTRGAVEQLGREELQGVVAHEFSHILHGDMRLNIRLIGLLHGILALSLLGRTLLSTVSHRSHSRVRKDRNSLTFPIVVVGGGLLLIGGIGVFFSRLIKSATNRQREFLADASAVQYTRNTAGLVGALKKIASIPAGSLIVHPRGEEASHLYFSDYVARRWLQLLSTHPPIGERIARLDGVAGRESGTHEAAESVGTDSAVLHVSGPKLEAVIGAIGEATGSCSAERINYARELLSSIPLALHVAASEPMGAHALVALLLLGGEPESEEQRRILSLHCDNALLREMERLAPIVATVFSSQRLALADLALPALRGLSPEQYASFRALVVALTGADGNCSLFEYAMQWGIIRALDGHFGSVRRQPPRYSSVQELRSSLEVLLSFVSATGAKAESDRDKAFARALTHLGFPSREALSASMQDLHAALAALEQSTPEVKVMVIQAVLICASHDGVVREPEMELTRAICDALDCPLPRLIIGAESPRSH